MKRVPRQQIVMELDGAWLVAIQATIDGDSVTTTDWCAVARPERVTQDDAAAVGTWVGETLRANGMSSKDVVCVASRGDVVLKTMSLPKSEDESDPAAIGEMVRLQMLRQLTVGGDGSSTDYIELGEEARDQGASVVSVLAGTMPGERMRWWRDMCAAAGLTISRVGLRCFGIAACAASVSQRRDGPVLAVVPGLASVDLSVIEAGRLRFARSTDGGVPLGAPEDVFVAFSERTTVEARRTWASYRATRTGADLESVICLDSSAEAKSLASVIGTALNCASETIARPSGVTVPESVPVHLRPLASSLAGLLVEVSLGLETIDFANPRRAPDRAARQRSLVLAAVTGAVVIGGGAYVASNQSLGAMRQQLAQLREKESELRQQRTAMLVKHARVNNLEQWGGGGGVDWISHFGEIVTVLPDSKDAQLNEMTGKASFLPGFTPKKDTVYPSGEWRTTGESVFTFSGDLDRRQVLADLRERLLEAGHYHIENRGPDNETRFAIDLIASLPAAKPAASDATKPAANQKPATQPTEGR